MTEDTRLLGIIPDNVVLTKIYLIRDQKVMIDRDLAELYGIETKRLKEAVRRNRKLFPKDFMFEMTKEELSNWRSQIATSNSEIMGLRYQPFCFTEQGMTMLSCVINSEKAILVNIHIIRIFTRMRELLIPNRDILQKLLDLESKGIDHDKKIDLIFKYLEQLRKSETENRNFKQRPRIGFKP
jgi:hypothetical protein